ncbi:MAG: sulfatase family protein [Aureliella sp.]
MAKEIAPTQTVSEAGRASRPNVIIFYTDDQGYGDASCLNPESRFKTPNIDRLASEGISFTDGHCSDSVCTPSRYGLLTGRYAWRTTLKKGVMGAEGKCLISPTTTTIASHLKSAGYATCMVGKWHLGMDFPGTSWKDRDWTKPVRGMPLDRGFDYFFGVPASLNYGVLAWFEGRYAKCPPTLFTNKKENARHVDYRIMPPYEDDPSKTKKLLGRLGMEVAEDFVDNQCLTRFTDKAIEWMQKHLAKSRQSGSQQPFFVYLPMTSPHYPVCPLPEFEGRGDAGAYGEFVLETDHHLGRILKFLRTQGIDDNTVLVYTSDNGPEKSWKERVEEFGHRSNGPLREGKRSAYEGGHRVPFLVRWPDGIRNPGRRSDHLVCQTDLIATLAEVTQTRLAENEGVDSVSFAAVLEDKPCRARPPLISHASNGRFAIREGKWKLLLPDSRVKRTELYDLSNDIQERVDLAQMNPNVTKDLQNKMTEIVVRGRTTEGSTQSNDTGFWIDLGWLSQEEYSALVQARN